jgi:hypothetical protein
MSQIIDGPLIADLEIITVKSNLPKPQEYKQHRDELHMGPSVGNSVALWERHEAHPNGEVMIAGDKPVRAARTERVVQKLRAEELVQVSDQTGVAAE